MTSLEPAITAQRECLTGRTAQALICELLLNVERAYLRGESLSLDWMIRQLSKIESELHLVA